MRAVFSEIAKYELEDAVSFYELEFEGLGKRFKSEVRSSINRILHYPNAWPTERREIRKCLLSKFPYKILYSIESDHIFIVALAHQHRKPDYWIERMEKK
jgi:hypothetical protein